MRHRGEDKADGAAADDGVAEASGATAERALWGVNSEKKISIWGRAVRTTPVGGRAWRQNCMKNVEVSADSRGLEWEKRTPVKSSIEGGTRHFTSLR